MVRDALRGRACGGVVMRKLLMPLGVVVLAAPALAGVDVAVDLPSSAAGTGTLAVRVFAPANLSETRYPEGAPVLIWGPGGTSEGSLNDPLRRATDVIRIVFLFPGGRDLATGRSSGGSYDFRGLASILALRDVLRYAAGELADSQGRRIDDVLPVPVLHHDIGLLGSSNGGNIVVAVAVLFGSELSGRLRYVIQWESPVSSQITLADLGPATLDCSGTAQRPSFRAPNPRYLGYGPLELTADYSQIAYDPSSATHPVFLDGNGNRRYDTVATQTSGCRTPDLSGNNALETSEDFPLSSHTVAGKQCYSRAVTRALRDGGVFGGSWPSSIATVEEADAYWGLREAVRLYPAATAAIPGVEAMVLASLEDHVQVAADHPHIRQAFEGWQGAGAPVKLNPGLSYLRTADSTLAARTDLLDLAFGESPKGWSDASSFCLPETVSVDAMQLAAVWQMADRARGR